VLPLAETVRQVTLTRLSGEVARRLAPIGRIAVPGEVHQPKAYRSGTFFLLKDRVAAVTVRVPAAAMRRSRVVHGERVMVTGRLDWQADRGSVLLLAEEVVPVGEGAVAAMVEAARQALAADGILDRPRRRLPGLPRLVGVVCGADAAVRHDIEAVVADRFPGLPLRFRECTVTGPGAAAAVEAALTDLLDDAGVDVVVLARGGGDATQLLPWSDEQLCRAVAAAHVPVVAAIGHEGDRPLVDEVADVRCGTPSMAAALVVPRRADLDARLAAALAAADRHLGRRVERAAGRLDRSEPVRALGGAVERASRRLDRAGALVQAAHPAASLHRARGRLGRCDWHTPAAAAARRAELRLSGVGGRLGDLGPAQVLRRGYAVVRDEAGAVVRDPATLVPGQRVEVEVAGGRFTAAVEATVA
jgi:exodeoxyribonuclease VII large subunit